jgi:tetratricopeptide (TPR) repeat protein
LRDPNLPIYFFGAKREMIAFDTATLEIIAYLAQRQRPVRLFVIGTYRPVETVVNKHPLRNLTRELYGRGQCEEVALELLTELEVEEYLRQRLGQNAALTELSQLIYHRTNGNALFVVSFVDSLLQQGLLVEADGQVQLQAAQVTLKRLMPRSVQQVILRQVERLAVDEQQLLRVASVGGMTFTAAEVAGVIGRALEEVEEKYDHLASQEGVLAIAGIAEGPDGAVTARYEFRHALCQQVVYEQLGQGRRIRLHRQLGEWKEARYGGRATEIANALALHFTEGREYHKAAQYHCQAGKVALGRSAYREAMDHCQKGLALLKRLPDTSERQRQELALRMLLSTALTVTQGFMAEELIQNLTRARELCHLLNDDASLVSVLVGPSLSSYARADREAVEQMMGEERRLLGRIQEPKLALQLHTVLGTSSMVCGALRQALEHNAQVLELYSPQWHQELVLRFGLDPAVMAEIITGYSLWLAGWPDQARTRVQHGCRRARELDHRYSLAFALTNAARVHLWCGEINEAERLAEDGVSVAREGGVWFMRLGSILLACSRVQRGEPEAAIALLTELIAQYRNIEVIYLLPLNLFSLADAYRQVGRVEEGLATIAEAVHITETRATAFWAAEVYRLKGELTLQQSKASLKQASSKSKASQNKSRVRNPPAPSVGGQSTIRLPPPSGGNPQLEEAEACFHKAIEIAKQQEAKSLELRAVRSLSRLWQQQGMKKEARTLLRETYGWFTEGFDTKDLQEAKALLDALRA